MKRKADHSLLLTESTAMDRLLAVSERLFNSLRIDVRVSGDLPLDFGKTNDKIGGNGIALFGVNGWHLSGLLSRRSVSDDDFVSALVSEFHEMRHAELFQRFQNETISDELIFPHLVKQGNPSYYWNNRYEYTTEIDAEYQGVMNAYDELNRMILENDLPADADKLICDYVNHKGQNYTYYISNVHDKPFTSIDEIDASFHEAYEKAVSREPVKRDSYGRADPRANYREFKPVWRGDDAVDFVTLPNGRIRPDKADIVDQIWDASNYDKDRMLASITLHLHPEYGSFYHGLDEESLKFETVFGRSLSEEQEIKDSDVPEY